MKQTAIQTFVSRFLILILNFGLVIFTTNYWGSSGKGIISIVIADLAIVGFVGNIFVGSSVTYFASKLKTEQILPYAYLWAVLSGFSVPFLIGFAHQQEFLSYLIILSVLTSLLSANINLFVGRRNIKNFNIYTILQQGLQILFILGLVYLFNETEVQTYFVGQILCLILLVAVSTYQILKHCDFSAVSFSKDIITKLFDYGYKTQLSSFLQFLNYRLSFYFIEFFKGLSSVGIYSIGVALSEAIWTVSRSLSLVLYSDVVNTSDQNAAIVKTKISLKISTLATLIFILILFAIPAQIYVLIFGKDFGQSKEVIFLLSPGILAIAASNILGNYFAGMNKLRILNVKSIVGVLFTIAGSWYLIPKWGIAGACIVTTVSYCVSSAILFWKFYQITDFDIRDFLLSKGEISLLLKSLQRRK
ncbi:polysaccharide biosynthesis C-terminal domain-containing protein [Chryseobacterium koreense]|uniref:polysaccharide biosynthesis C-terminal domain-containing protein n=1 Tax=Chryseobacterium koreense TaxID=232216 RepID=UPI0026E993C3|nr:polysaccharide biosynthesis C-terminal domain-containing protein [Chryseobacterium koreense]